LFFELWGAFKKFIVMELVKVTDRSIKINKYFKFFKIFIYFFALTSGMEINIIFSPKFKNKKTSWCFSGSYLFLFFALGIVVKIPGS